MVVYTGGFRLEERARLLFLIAELREAPDLFGDVGVVVATRVECAENAVED